MIDQTKPYTPLNTDNSARVLVDHQVGLMVGSRSGAVTTNGSVSTPRHLEPGVPV